MKNMPFLTIIMLIMTGPLVAAEAKQDAKKESHLEVVTLKNGVKVPLASLKAVHASICDLFEGGDRLVFDDLVEKAKNPQYSVWGSRHEQILKKHALLSQDGRMPQDVAEIIRVSWTTGLLFDGILPIEDIIEQ